MKKLALVVASAALLMACEPIPQADPSAFRDAVPQPSAIRVATPDDAAASLRGEVTSAPGSDYAEATYAFASTVNVGTAWTLGIIRRITAFPPSACADGTCTWGPWHDDDDNLWELGVTASTSEVAYHYALSARPGSAPATADFAPILEGVAYPGAALDRGRGGFAVDFDAEAALDHGSLWQQERFGTLQVAYDNRARLAIDAVARGAHSEGGEVLNAAYAFTALPTGCELQIAYRTITGVPKRGSLRSRWDSTGTGRGDMQSFAADGTYALQYQASECWADWAGGLAVTYDTEPAMGGVMACAPAFRQPSYADLAVP